MSEPEDQQQRNIAAPALLARSAATMPLALDVGIPSTHRAAASPPTLRESRARDYVAACLAEIKSAQESGHPEPEFYPHPDDVVIVPGQPLEILGPASKNEAIIYRNIVATRDLFIMQATLGPMPHDHQISIELLLAMRMNGALPARMRLDDDAWFQLDRRSCRTSRRQLEKQIQSGWRDLGIAAPRGFTFPFLDRKRLAEQVARRSDVEGAN